MLHLQPLYLQPGSPLVPTSLPPYINHPSQLLQGPWGFPSFPGAARRPGSSRCAALHMGNTELEPLPRPQHSHGATSEEEGRRDATGRRGRAEPQRAAACSGGERFSDGRGPERSCSARGRAWTGRRRRAAAAAGLRRRGKSGAPVATGWRLTPRWAGPSGGRGRGRWGFAPAAAAQLDAARGGRSAALQPHVLLAPSSCRPSGCSPALCPRATGIL